MQWWWVLPPLALLAAAVATDRRSEPESQPLLDWEVV